MTKSKPFRKVRKAGGRIRGVVTGKRRKDGILTKAVDTDKSLCAEMTTTSMHDTDQSSLSSSSGSKSPREQDMIETTEGYELVMIDPPPDEEIEDSLEKVLVSSNASSTSVDSSFSCPPETPSIIHTGDSEKDINNILDSNHEESQIGGTTWLNPSATVSHRDTKHPHDPVADVLCNSTMEDFDACEDEVDPPTLDNLEDNKINQDVLSDTPSKNTFSIVVLLMNPLTRQFEFVKYDFDPERANVCDILARVIHGVTDEKILSHSYVGVCDVNGQKLSSSLLVSELSKARGQLVLAIPEGTRTTECASLATRILSDPKIIHVLQSNDISYKVEVDGEREMEAMIQQNLWGCFQKVLHALLFAALILLVVDFYQMIVGAKHDDVDDRMCLAILQGDEAE